MSRETSAHSKFGLAENIVVSFFLLEHFWGI